MNPSALRSLLGFAGALTAASVASAFTYITADGGQPIKWFVPSIAIQIKVDNSTPLSDGLTRAASIQAAMLDAQRGWNHYLGTVQFLPQVMGVGSGADGNSLNEIFFSTTPYDQTWGANTLAVTTAWVSGGERVEADIIFNPAFTWDSYRGALRATSSAGPYDMQRVALHELGHVLGLDHPDEYGQSVTALMNSYISNLDSLAADDIAGVQGLYGVPGVLPDNDDFANATTITFGSGSLQLNGTNVAATKQLGEPLHAGDTGGRSVWWKWTPSTGGTASLTTAGSNFDTLLAVYTGTSVSTLTTVASSDDVVIGSDFTSAVSFTFAAGTTYYFAVDGWGGASGSIRLNLSVAQPVLPAFYSQPSSAATYVGQSVSFSAYANGTPAPTYQWQRWPAGGSAWANLSNGGSYLGATGSTLGISNCTLAMSGDQFRCVATNSAGTATSLTATLTVYPPAPPAILNLPAGIALSTGDTLALAPTITGTEPITYQWKKDGVVLPGATLSTYTMVNVTSADNGQYTLTATNAVGTVTSAAVTVTVSAPLNIVRLVADRYRPRIYALKQDGIGAGAVLVIDPATAAPMATLPVGLKPTDCSISADGNEMLVICSASPCITVINLATLQVTDTIALTTFGQWGVNDTGAHIKHGSGNIIYYSDGTWAPVMRVFDRSTQTVLQSLMLDGTAPNNNGGYGFGDFALTPDKTALFAWGQYGWMAGSAGSNVARYVVNPNGTLALAQTGNLSYPTFLSGPYNTPVLVTADGASVFIKQYRFSTSSVASPVQSFSSPVLAITPRGEIVATNSALYERATGNQVYSLNPVGSVQAITADYSRLVYYDSTARQLRTVDLIQGVGPATLGLNSTPANGSFVLPPTQLQWTPQTGAGHYRVYFGTSATAVAAATMTSPEYLGEVSVNSYTLGAAPAPGATYYWRVDAVTDAGVIPGIVFSFTVASVSASLSRIDASTVTGDRSQKVDVNLAAATAGKTWTASTSAPWISFDNASGTAPATLRVQLDASIAPVGLNLATITITSNDGAFNLPVQFRVDPLALSLIRSAPGTTNVYAISEEGAANYTGFSRAYLLEIDTLFKRISRVTRVGTGVTDLAVHAADNRVYVTNWKIGSLLAVDLGSFAVTRTYGFSPFGGMGSSSNDVFRVSAGGPGRVVVEPEDQWVNIALYNTTTGTTLASTNLRQGGGAFDPTGRYYFHGDDNISDAALQKFDTAGDQFGSPTQVKVAGFSYYGDRTVLVAANGHRVFWNGVMVDENLSPVWTIGALIYSISSDGRYAFGASAIYDTVQRQTLGTMPVTTTVSAFNSYTGQLVMQSGSSLLFYTLPNAILPEQATTPANGGIVLPPATLQWQPLPGVGTYQVYLGLSASAVQTATTASPEYLGQASSASFTLAAALPPGQTYYWRVDSVVGSDVGAGAVRSFSVSTLMPSVSAIEATTVKGDTTYAVDLGLTAAQAGQVWSAVASDPWITFDQASGTTPATLKIRFNAALAPTGANHATITVTGAGGAFNLPVLFQVDALSLTTIRSAPGTTKVYAISEVTVANSPGYGRAYLLEIDTLFKRISRVAKAGTGVTDLAVHPGDNRVYVTNWQLGSLLAIDLGSFALARTYAFTPFGNVGYSGNDVFRISAGGPGRLIVESEDQWISIALFDTVAGTTLNTTFQRQGGGAFDPTGRFYYHGDDNSSNAALRKFDTAGDIFTTLNQVTVTGINGYGSRTVVMSESGHRIFWNGAVFDENLTFLWNIGVVIYSTSSDGRYAFGATTIYDTVLHQAVASMPAASTVSAYNSLTGQLVVQNGSALTFNVLPNAIVPEQATTPANGAIVLPPTSLQWTPLPGASAYRVYLGLSAASVQTATTASPEYLGQVSSASFTLMSPLTPGVTYYWRFDPVVGNETVVGGVRSFTVSSLRPSLSAIEATTVKGDLTCAVDLGLTAAQAGQPWSAAASAPWITFDSVSGTTPATLRIRLNADLVPTGSNQATITITGNGSAFTLPVQFQVDPLALTVIRSAPGTTKVYAISEVTVANSPGYGRAYLLEIDTLFKRISRVAKAGAGVTDLAVHPGDNRVYVTNWRLGSLLAIDLGSFALARTYAFTPFSNVGYSSTDAYRISAGGPGRLIVEPEDQWIYIALFDTAAGTTLTTTFQRQGGGAYDPTGRYYFHGDDNISNAALHKFDTAGDQYTAQNQVSVTGITGFGDRTVVMSENGHRIFWNGAVFDENLAAVWNIGTVIYSTSSDGRYAFGATTIYDTVLRQVVGGMPVLSLVSAYNSLTGQLVVQNGSALTFNALPNAIVPEQSTTPANGSIVLPPTVLQWTPLPGASAYRVYLGVSAASVQTATTTSPEYLGQVSSASFTLMSPLTPGVTYYWRFDPVVGGEIATGSLRSFLASSLRPSLIAIEASTVAGDATSAVDLGLISAGASLGWTATASAPWITFDATSGTTPATLRIRLNGSTAPVGLNQANITITSSDGSFTLPVRFRVDPLALTVIRSAPGSPMVYAISEEGAASYTGLSRAYLLEIDTSLRRISRVVRVGTGVTDLALHPGDGCIYVTNWKIGSLLAVDLGTFALNRTYAFSPFGNVGYGTNDVFRVSAGGPGRLITEPEDQWVYISLYDTVAASSLATSFQRQGGGAFDPAGRYYYHGDDNSSGAALHKLDTAGAHFTEVGSLRPATVASGYGDRTVVMSEDGHRVFWDGTVFDENLTSVWGLGAIIYTASADGRYAFGSASIYDTVLKQVVGAMPVSTPVSAFNSGTGQLVLQSGSALLFYSLPNYQLAPSVVLQPQAQSVVAGHGVTFSTVVLGAPDPTYQWQRNGVNLAGATTATLNLGNVRVTDAGIYRVVSSNASGTTTSNGVMLTVSNPAGLFGDFNGDGHGDILLTNNGGERAIWLLNGTGISAGASLGLLASNWQFSGTGDFNGDGMTDIILTNTTTGERAIWLMNGTAIAAGASLGVLAVDWTVSGTGDFNGDGRADILLTNTVTGERAIWLMNGASIGSGASLGVLPGAWVFSSTGDFNGDSRSDIVLTNSITGERAIWLMNGTNIGAGASLGILSTTWAINGTGDFNGDGRNDILLTNASSGDRAIWFMNSAAIGSGASLGILSPNWVFSRIGDFNDDGMADIFLTNTVTGERAIWLMNGTTITAGSSLGILSTNWLIRN